MQTIKRDIYVTKNVLQAPIEVTEGTNSIAIEFDVRDYEIPASAAAVAYSLSTSSMEEPNKALADVSGNKITIIPSEAFFLPGQNVMQIRIIDGNSKLISFNIIVKCTGKMRFGDEKEEQQSTLVEQMLAKLGEYQKKSASPYNFKGSCLSSELPASGNTINDTYYCTDLKYRKTWNGSAWEQSSLNEADYEDELTKTNGEVSSLKEDIVDLDTTLLNSGLSINYLLESESIKGSVWTNPDGGIYNADDYKRWAEFTVPAGVYEFSNLNKSFSYYKNGNRSGALTESPAVFDVDTKIYASTGIDKKATFRNKNILNVEEINEKVSILENDVEGMKDGINLLFSNNVIEGSVWTNPDGGIYNADGYKRWKPFEVKKGTYYYYGGSGSFCCYKTQNDSGYLKSNSVTFTESAIIYFSAGINSDCYFSNKPKDDTDVTAIHIGVDKEFNTLTSGINFATTIGNCTVYVDDGLYDIIEEYGGNDYFENLTENEVYQNPGIVLGNNVHVIFSSGAKVVCNYTGNNQYVKMHFAPFNADKRTLQMGVSSDFIIENCICEASNVKYVVHDEYNGFDVTYKHIYKNCKFKLDNTNNEYRDTQSSFGGGCGTYGYIELDGCNVIVVPINGVIGTGISWHNANNNYAGTDVSNNRIFIKNCVTNGSIYFGAYGTSETISTMTICGSKFYGEPIHEYINNPPYCTVDNVEIIEWNNTKLS